MINAELLDLSIKALEQLKGSKLESVGMDTTDYGDGSKRLTIDVDFFSGKAQEDK